MYHLGHAKRLLPTEGLIVGVCVASGEKIDGVWVSCAKAVNFFNKLGLQQAAPHLDIVFLKEHSVRKQHKHLGKQ